MGMKFEFAARLNFHYLPPMYEGILNHVGFRLFENSVVTQLLLQLCPRARAGFLVTSRHDYGERKTLFPPHKFRRPSLLLHTTLYNSAVGFVSLSTVRLLVLSSALGWRGLHPSGSAAAAAFLGPTLAQVHGRT